MKRSTLFIAQIPMIAKAASGARFAVMTAAKIMKQMKNTTYPANFPSGRIAGIVA